MKKEDDLFFMYGHTFAVVKAFVDKHGGERSLRKFDELQRAKARAKAKKLLRKTKRPAWHRQPRAAAA